MLWLVLTTGKCNLSCRYCGGSFPQRYAPWDVKYSVDDLAKLVSGDSDPTVIFYGGEPLLNPRFIMEVMDRVPARRFGIQTNGLAVKALPPEYWRRMSVVLLSIDGVKEVTDAYRGPGVYNAVLRALKWLRSIGCTCRVVARMAVTRLSDIYRDATHLLGLGFDAVHWQLNIIWTDDWGPDEFLDWAERSYLPSIAKLRDLFVYELKKGRVLQIVPFIGIYRALLGKPYRHVPCGAGQTAFAVNTDGRILACPIAVREDWAVVGNVKIGVKARLELPERCLACAYRPYCGGRCLYVHHESAWGAKGLEAMCSVTMRTVDTLAEALPTIKELVDSGVISEAAFDYIPEYESTEVVP